MRLRAHRLDLDAGDRYIVVLNVSDAKGLHVLPGERVEVQYGERSAVAVVDVSTHSIPPGVVGLFADVWQALGVPEGEWVDVEPSVDPHSLLAVRKKIDGDRLSRDEIFEIIGDIMAGRLTTAEAAAFVVAVHLNGMDHDETAFLTEAIAESGEMVRISKHPVVDKHCIGGVPNNRTTMIFVPVMASLGFYVPKTSSRAITSPAGTADTMEVLARVDLSAAEIKEITESVGGVIAWGGGTGMAAADDKLIQIRRPLSLDPRPLLLASIMAKKRAVHAEYLIVDIPVGAEAKVKGMKEAEALGKDFIRLGERLGMRTKVIITDGSFPIGRGVGPALEARDVLSVLSGRGPEDLFQKAAEVAAQMLAFLRGIPVSAAFDTVVDQIRSGAALKKMREIIEAQEGDPDVGPEDIEVGKERETVYAEKAGKVTYISNRGVSAIARAAGAPFDKGAGIYLHVRVGDKVRRGDPLFTVFSGSKKRLRYALEMAGNVLRLDYD